MEQEQKSIPQIIEEVCNEMCDKYCKYPEQYSSDEWDKVIEEICGNCPLNKLS